MCRFEITSEREKWLVSHVLFSGTMSPRNLWWHSRQMGFFFADDGEKQINENSNNVLQGIARLLPFSLSYVYFHSLFPFLPFKINIDAENSNLPLNINRCPSGKVDWERQEPFIEDLNIPSWLWFQMSMRSTSAFQTSTSSQILFPFSQWVLFSPRFLLEKRFFFN